MSKSDLPPPVTIKSSKKDLWEELEASRNEIHSQQRLIVEQATRIKLQAETIENIKKEVQSQTAALQAQVAGYKYQLDIIRLVLTAEA